MELWASPEPTIARVSRNHVRDLLAESGHERRLDDIDRLAALGIAKTRYPVLWEKVEARRGTYDFGWCDERLERLSAFGVEPVVTLLHHGQGPAWTSLLDDGFPSDFARYAEQAARRYPWVRWWTPINEMLTTARFSTLYGSWYPNLHDDHSAFGHTLVNEALATCLAMERIRAIIPGAKLLTTEDLQRFEAGDRGVMAYVQHKRERMYLSNELVMGRVLPGHPLWAYLTRDCQVPAPRLHALALRAAVIDVAGFNYYPNSERYLWTNPDRRFGNVALVDVERGGFALEALLQAAGERLAVPLAMTEIHVDAGEDARVRWFLQRFDDVERARHAGVQVVAFGAWAAFGMIDWRSLLTRREGAVEDGVFGFSPAPQAPPVTRLATAIRELARGGRPPLPAAPGWWETPLDNRVAS